MIKKQLFRLLMVTVMQSFFCTPPAIEQPVPATETDASLPNKTVLSALSWKPNLPPEELDLTPLLIYQKISVTLKSLDDVRSDPRIIGKTLEDKKIQDSFIPLATRNNVSKWFREGTISTIKGMKIPYSDKKGALQLELELAQCEIEDNITQTGKISLNVSAYTDSELLIWEGKISGTSDLYYRPKDSDGISECLSNTTKVTINNLFIEQSFRDAVIKAFELE